MIKFRCRVCNKKIGVPDEIAGKKVKCPQCNSANDVPLPIVVAESPDNLPIDDEKISSEDLEVLDDFVEQGENFSKNSTVPKQYKISEPTKHCPYCNEEILMDVIRCKHCGKYITSTSNSTDNIVSTMKLSPKTGQGNW